MLSTLSLDKRLPIPLYFQLAEAIKDKINSGMLEPGDRLPSGWELARKAGVSRMTVRQAVAYLVQEGVLVVKPGIGTFVAEPKLHHTALHLLGFTEEMMQQGETVTSRVIEQSITTPPSGIATKLGLDLQEEIVKIVRLRLSSGEALLLETSYIPASLCPGLETHNLECRSLYGLLEQHYQLRLDHASQTFEATVANEYEGDLFGIRYGTPMILVEGIAYLKDNRPVEYFRGVYRADRFKFSFESQRSNEANCGPGITVMLV